MTDTTPDTLGDPQRSHEKELPAKRRTVLFLLAAGVAPSALAVSARAEASGSSQGARDLQASASGYGENGYGEGGYGGSTSTSGPAPLPGFQNAPTDPDGDGVYEDVNGDGTFNIADVQALFANRNSQVVQNNQAAFDFNGDGTFNIADVQALFVAAIS